MVLSYTWRDLNRKVVRTTQEKSDILTKSAGCLVKWPGSLSSESYFKEDPISKSVVRLSTFY